MVVFIIASVSCLLFGGCIVYCYFAVSWWVMWSVLRIVYLVGCNFCFAVAGWWRIVVTGCVFYVVWV